MKQKLLALNYQRNGISGEGFFAAAVQNLNDTKGRFLITFVTEGDKDEIDTSSCRCMMLEGADNPFYQCWRGDKIGCDLGQLLNELKEKYNVESWYDLHTIYENKATGSDSPISYKTKQP